jgi:hypothetical protein
MGEAELGYVSLLELQSVRGKLGLPVERYLHFDADYGAQRRIQNAVRLRRRGPRLTVASSPDGHDAAGLRASGSPLYQTLFLTRHLE